MSEVPRIVASRRCDLFEVDLREDGILVYRPVAGAQLTQQVARQVLALGLELVGAGPKPTLVMMEDVGRVDRPAREVFASEEYLRLSCRTALVVGSPVSRVIGNFFVGLNRLKYPCKVFDDPARALEWLHALPS